MPFIRYPEHPRQLPCCPNKLITTVDIQHCIYDIHLRLDVSSDHIPLIFRVAHGHVKYPDCSPPETPDQLEALQDAISTSITTAMSLAIATKEVRVTDLRLFPPTLALICQKRRLHHLLLLGLGVHIPVRQIQTTNQCCQRCYPSTQNHQTQRPLRPCRRRLLPLPSPSGIQLNSTPTSNSPFFGDGCLFIGDVEKAAIFRSDVQLAHQHHEHPNFDGIAQTTNGHLPPNS